MKKGLIATMIGVVGAISAMAPSYHATRSTNLPGVQVRDYLAGPPSQPAKVFSLDPVELPRTPADGAVKGLVRPRVKVYRAALNVVQNEHCSLAGVALALQETGEWNLSFTAHQNPWMIGPKNLVSGPTQIPGPTGSLRLPIPPLTFETEGLKRNLFTVTVKCYGDFPRRPRVPVIVNRPVLYEIKPAPFWVQRGTPYDFQQRCGMYEVAQYFDLVDRVEVEFTWR